jgi:hypothetical protein
MSLNVFLSYSTTVEEQVIVWRLQTLAAAHGINLYVPPREGFKALGNRTPLLPGQVEQAIGKCDCVLAIITSRTSRVVERELNYALGKNKLIIPIVDSAIADSRSLSRFPHIFRFDPNGSTTEVESQIIAFLKQQQVSQENRKALAALVAIGLGMWALSSLSEG